MVIVDAVEDWAVFQPVSTVKHIRTVGYAEGLAGLVVDIAQHTAGIVVNHIHQRRTEYRLEAHQQLVDLLLLEILVGDIVLDAKHTAHTALHITAGNGHINLVAALQAVVLHTAAQLQRG